MKMNNAIWITGQMAAVAMGIGLWFEFSSVVVAVCAAYTISLLVTIEWRVSKKV